MAAAIAPICVLGLAALPAARRLYPRATFWGVIAALTVAATVFAETVDTSLGIGDLPARLHVAALLLLAIVLDYRLAGMIGFSFDNWSQECFFWLTG
jgi:uncharacterized membrane-anchored protein